MKKLTYLLVVAAVAFGVSGCGAAKEAELNNHQQSLTGTETMYVGDAKWSVVYDEQFFGLSELTPGTDIQLTYTGDCKGSAYVELAEEKGQTAKELVEAKKAEYIETSQVYEVNDENKSGYVFYVPDITFEMTEGDNRYTSVEVIDSKDGALVITSSQMADDEMQVSDCMSDIINSIEVH